MVFKTSKAKTSKLFDVIAFANTFAIIDLILHPLFRLWISVSPESYEHVLNLFVAGWQLEVTPFDLSLSNIVVGTILEAAGFWLFGAVVALLYNKLAK
ncbi:hypothetical protein HYS47_02930 [Candidatus Woesearchaeota archaeon]|nr:hypothetical protein [Candidatus Woesearchaeota archaeon]